MRTSPKIFNKISIFLISFIMFTFSCSDDPSSPEKEKPIDAVTIGTDGGIIEKGDLKITIPTGAFDGNYDISVSEVEDDSGFGENTATPIFKIRGLPDKINKSLKIDLKYKGTLSNNTYFVVDTKSESDSLISSGLFLAKDSSGYVIGYIPTTYESGNNTILKKTKVNDDHLDKVIYVITDYLVKESANFIFQHPANYSTDIDELITNCENTLSFIKNDIGLNYFSKENTINIVLRNKWSPSNSVFGLDAGIQKFLFVDISQVSNKKFELINAEMGAFLFELESPREKFEPDDYIFQSFRYIIKELLYADGDFILPFDLDKNKFEPFNGWTKENTANSAIGFTPILKYLISENLLSLSGIGEMFEKVNEGSSLQYALINSIEESITDWFPNFFKKYVNNELYDFPGNYFLSETHKEWNINTETDIQRNFNSSEVGTYQDLSAKIFKINLNYSELDNIQKLSFLINGPNNNQGLSLILFSVKDNKLEYVGTSNETGAELQDLKGYYDLGIKQFLAILVNSNISQADYLGQSDIDLTISIKSITSSQLNYNRCAISVDAFVTKTDNRWEDGIRTIIETDKISTGRYLLEGSFSGNTFTGTYTDAFTNASATVTLNDAHDMVLDYSFGRVEINNLTPPIKEVSGASGKNIPKSLRWEDVYQLDGEDACQGISTLLYNWTWDWQEITLTGYSCDAWSQVWISFSEE